jgi:hypothetical protein
MRSRFAAVRLRVAQRDYWRNEPHPEQQMLIEWPTTEKEPTKYWLSNLHESISLRKLVAIAKLRWRIERDYEELKQELGLGHFEGRNWRGFHHHATLSIAAHSFLVLERCLFPLKQLAANQGSRHQDSHTPRAIRLDAQRRCPFAQNGIILNPLPPCADRPQPTLYDLCPVVCICAYNPVVLERSPLGVFVSGTFFPDGLFAVVLFLRIFEGRFITPSDFQEAVHAN